MTGVQKLILFTVLMFLLAMFNQAIGMLPDTAKTIANGRFVIFQAIHAVTLVSLVALVFNPLRKSGKVKQTKKATKGLDD